MKIAIASLIALIPLTGCLAQDTEMSGNDEPASTTAERPDAAVPQGENMQLPEGWIVRLDAPDPSVKIGSADASDIYFVNMTPGWHITAHKRAIYYHPASTASGNFSATAAINLFETGGRDREGFGIFVGGKQLESDDLRYVYFLLRNTGDFLIKERTGGETRVLVDWTATEAMTVHPGEGSDSVLNTLEVRSDAESVTFHVNGTQVAVLSADELDVDGIVGLRANHGLNLHISELDVSM
jgi:hypothetical protein